MEGLQADGENSVLLSLPKETLVCVIGQLCAKIRLLKSQLADAEKRNRFLQHELPKLIKASISSVVLAGKGDLITSAEHRRASEEEESEGECNGEQAECRTLSPHPRNSPPTSNSPVDVSRIPQLSCTAPGDVDLSGPSLSAQADANAFQLQSAVMLNLLGSLLNPTPPTNNCQEVNNGRRKRKIVPQKMPSSSQVDSTDVEVPAVEESAVAEVDSASGPSPTSLRAEDADTFKSFLLDPIPLPLTPLCWPTVPPPAPQSSEPLLPPRKPDPFPGASAMRLRSANVVAEEAEDDEEEEEAETKKTVRVKGTVKLEGQPADAETEEVSDETLNEVEADITSSTSLRKRRYWQLYLESNGWTRATCALMSCLFSRHQMANSTVFGRQSVCGKIRSRLPAKLVHFIVSRISRRFGVLPSKVRAKMAQKCKDVRRVARKSTDETLPQLPPLNSFCLPSTTTST
ncbi:hypothetical protein SprV_0301302000 [Sparganum proliferum]